MTLSVIKPNHETDPGTASVTSRAMRFGMFASSLLVLGLAATPCAS